MRSDKALAVAAHNGLCVGHLLIAANDEQKRRFLPNLASGEWVGAWGLTEAQAGSDAAGTQTRASWDGEQDRWVLNGSKTFNTNGSRAHVAVVHAVTDPERGNKGISAFIVERGTAGFAVGHKENKLGMRASDTVELILKDCVVPAENLLGERDSGFVDAMKVLDGGRISIAALAVGVGQAAVDAAIGYMRRREQFGRPIGSFEALQDKIARAATRVEAARLLTWRAAQRRECGLPYKTEASIAKLFASEAAMVAAEESVQIFGGYGYVKGYPVEKLFRDAKLCTIGEGTSEIQRLVLSRQILSAAS